MTNTFDANRSVTFTVIGPVPNPHIAIDTPTPNQTVTSAFEVGGWLLDAGATTGTGVDDVKIYVQLPGGPAPGVFIGHGRLGLARADVGAIYGARFNRVGFHFTITGLSPEVGDTLWVIGHDTLTNADTISTSVPFNVDAKALMSIDVPSARKVESRPTRSSCQAGRSTEPSKTARRPAPASTPRALRVPQSWQRRAGDVPRLRRLRAYPAR